VTALDPALELTPDHQYVVRSAAERGVRFVRLWFVDVLGILKSISIPVSELESVLVDGVSLDGSALEGFERPNERDVIAYPDPGTFQVIPWRPDTVVARMFCELRTPDGQPAFADSRYALRRALAQAADLGFAFLAGAEVEFFLFADQDHDGPPTPLDTGTYFDFTPVDAGSDFRRRVIEHLEVLGIPVKASHHEVGPSQHEIDIEHADALSLADALTTLRLAAKEVALASGVHATFMPKPLEGVAGNGLHLHLSLLSATRNVFHDADADPDLPLSEVGRAFLAGVLAHAREISLVTNQWTNSYKRLVPGFEAPESASWTRYGRSSLVRVPVARPGRASATRIELRSPDPSCNPYLALACILAAGLRGIERDYALPPEDDATTTPALPHDLREAVLAFSEADLVREALGDRLCEAILRNKHADLATHRRSVTDLERRRLLRAT